MSSPATSARPGSPRRGRSRVIVAVAIALALVAAITIGSFVTRWVVGANWRPPDFPSLAQQPDSSLQGTVAYFADQSRCVRVVAAAGQPEKDVLCVASRSPRSPARRPRRWVHSSSGCPTAGWK